MALVYPAPLPILAYLATGSSGGPLCSGRVAHFASGTLAQFGPENALDRTKNIPLNVLSGIDARIATLKSPPQTPLIRP